MNYQRIQQQTPEWWSLKVGKISGTRFGQLISGRDNQLIDEMANEMLDGQCMFDDFENEDMLFGVENEPIALELFSKRYGIELERGGVILSDFSDIHMASPDAVNEKSGIVVEVKCTQWGKTQISRFRRGVESKYLPQIINYFAVSDNVKEVYLISYCPYRPERDLVVHKFTRDTVIEQTKTKEVTVQDKVIYGRSLLSDFKTELNELVNNFKTIQF